MDQYTKRFSGIARLLGVKGAERLRRAHACIVGIGGVGSYVVEALARSGLGHLTLVDLDDVCISNVNRQLHALDGELGKPKVEVMERRVRAINPDCVIHARHCFFVTSNAAELLSTRFDALVDAIDTPSLKALLIARCRERSIPVITVGGAGGRRDPTAIEVTDLAFSTHDRLLQDVRRRLRKEHGFPRGNTAFGVDCVLSREPAVYPSKDGSVCEDRPVAGDLRLDCDSGFGTASFVTGTFGFVAAARAVDAIVRSDLAEQARAAAGSGERQPDVDI